MNERGFFTIVGLCLLMVAAIFIKGIQEFETNYSNVTTNFQAEHELQNAAESYLIDAFENLPQLAEYEPFDFPVVNLTSEKLKNVKVERHAKNIYLRRYIREYSSGGNITDIENEQYPRNVMLIISVASCDNPFVGGKMYRRALAYKDGAGTIHFMKDL